MREKEERKDLSALHSFHDTRKQAGKKGLSSSNHYRWYPSRGVARFEVTAAMRGFAGVRLPTLVQVYQLTRCEHHHHHLR